MSNPTVSSEIEKLLNQIYQEDGLTFEEALSKLEELIVRAKIEELKAARHEHQFDNFYERCDKRISELETQLKQGATK